MLHGSDRSSAGRASRLQRILGDLLTQAPEIEAAAVVTFDGLPMASALPPGMDEGRVAAMSAALLSLGERAAEGLGRGELSQVYIEAADGTVFLVSADDEAVLVAVAAQGAKAGLMLFEVRRAAQSVADALRSADVPTPASVIPPPAAPAPEPAAYVSPSPSLEPEPTPLRAVRNDAPLADDPFADDPFSDDASAPESPSVGRHAVDPGYWA
jgi:predicted regulator of Ras-like GTPase activity (Roadblock/LC7/MglB family)